MAQPIDETKNNNPTVEQLLRAITDILAKTELVVSDSMNVINAHMNTITALNNTRMYYIKLMSQLSQGQGQGQQSISSK
jgi:hypothetical protein